MEQSRETKETYTGDHLRNEITRIPIAVCLFDWGCSSFRCERRADELFTEEIQRGQYNAQDKDDYI